MISFVIEGPNKWGLREVPDPQCGPSEIVVRVSHVGVCASDYEILIGTRPVTHVSYPIIPGHEWVGEIVEVGHAAADLHVGQLVVVEGVFHCGRCRNCVVGNTNLCLKPYNEIGFTHSGAFGQYVVAPAYMAHPVEIAAGVARHDLALVEPCACAVNAGLLAQPGPGDSVAVVGGGTVGLLLCQYVAMRNARSLVVFDHNPARLSLARQLGATGTVLTNDRNPDMPNGFDIVFEAVGHPSAVQTALRIGRKGSHIVLLGIAGRQAQLSIESDLFVLNALRISGIFSYTRRSFAESADLVSRGRIQAHPLIEKIVSLTSAAEAIQHVGTGKLSRPKVLVDMQRSILPYEHA